MSRSILTAALCATLLGVCAVPASAKGIGSLFSCDAEGSANTTGAVVGGLVGAGSAIAGCLTGPAAELAGILKAIEEKGEKAGDAAPAPEAATAG